MLESNEFEAVVIATPDHWHAKAAIMAMQAGKHVYLEKPTSHNPAENEMLVRATLKYNRVVQVGNQRRSFPNVIKAMEEIKSGTIGKVRYAKSWYVNNRPSIGTGKVIPVPDYLDWDLWQGPAPRFQRQLYSLQLALVLELGNRRSFKQRNALCRYATLGIGSRLPHKSRLYRWTLPLSG